MTPFATLLPRWPLDQDVHLKFLLTERIKPEINLEFSSIDLKHRYHRELAKMLKGEGLASSIHLPFVNIRPGSKDSKRIIEARDRLREAAELAASYEAEHLIGHPEFRPHHDSIGAEQKGGSTAPKKEEFHTPSESWLENSVNIWQEVLATANNSKLYLENTADSSPEPVRALVAALPPRAGICFDLGHWFYAAEGHALKNLPHWLESYAPRLGHLHLHDNHGFSDEHLGMGDGLIDFDEFFNLLKEKGLKPTFTLEAHTLTALKQSLSYLKKH